MLRELLSRGIRPVAFDLRANPSRWETILGADAARVEFAEGSLLEPDRLRQACDDFGVSHVIHLAALLTPACQEDPWEGCRVNVLGSVALFELARARPEEIRGFSYASSYAVYGPEADDAPASVASPANRPPTFYGAFKMAVDLIAEQYWRHFGVASVAIRPHVVYGPERNLGLTAGPSLAARAAARGETYAIGYTGAAGYDYVEDVAHAFVRAALETPRGANVVDLPGKRATPQEFVAAIEAAVPGAAEMLSVDGPPIAANLPTSPNFIANLFPDWRSTSLTDGVRRTVDFYRSRSTAAHASETPP